MNTISNYRSEPNTDPIWQTWKLLRFFLSREYTVGQLRKVQRLPHDRSLRRNIEKQADQVGFCIQQAQDYFHSASQVTLSTRPLLLYYGAISLSQALVLTVRDGTHSFDYRRKNRELGHRHHGLELVSELATSGTMKEILESLQCKIHVKNDVPWGQFALFYNSLIPPAVAINARFRSSGSREVEEVMKVARSFDYKPSAEDLSSRTFSVLDLVKSMPDMFFHLRDLNILPGELGRVHIDIDIERFAKEYVVDPSPVASCHETVDITADGFSPKSIPGLLNFYGSNYGELNVTDVRPMGISMRQVREYNFREGYPILYATVVDNVAGQPVFVLNPAEYLIEPAAHFIVLFCLSMYCRYHPDLWMRTIADARSAELLESLLAIITRRFPNMILDQLTRTKYQFQP